MKAYMQGTSHEQPRKSANHRNVVYWVRGVCMGPNDLWRLFCIFFHPVLLDQMYDQAAHQACVQFALCLAVQFRSTSQDPHILTIGLRRASYRSAKATEHGLRSTHGSLQYHIGNGDCGIRVRTDVYALVPPGLRKALHSAQDSCGRVLSGSAPAAGAVLCPPTDVCHLFVRLRRCLFAVRCLVSSGFLYLLRVAFHAQSPY
jgi:hypothetical protein